MNIGLGMEHKHKALELLQQCCDSCMLEVLRLIEAGANSPSVILIGETGVGKEVVARALHEKGDRKEGSFVILDCGNQNKDLMGSELFGHERGAYTGAIGQRIGRFEQADNGTLFLDEIGELPLELQSRLLRVLETQEFMRVGGSHTIKSDFRLIAATNRDLGEMVREGSFREDLFYRINVFIIPIPPLRKRMRDIGRLASFFADELADGSVSIDSETEVQLRLHDWPGNIRELRNVMQQAVLLANGDGVIRPEHLMLQRKVAQPVSRSKLATSAWVQLEFVADEGGFLKAMHSILTLAAQFRKERKGVAGDEILCDTVEKYLILAALAQSGDNKVDATALLGISRQTLYNKMEKYGIDAGE